MIVWAFIPKVQNMNMIAGNSNFFGVFKSEIQLVLSISLEDTDDDGSSKFSSRPETDAGRHFGVPAICDAGITREH